MPLAEPDIKGLERAVEVGLDDALRRNEFAFNLVENHAPSIQDGHCLVVLPKVGMMIARMHPKLLGIWLRDCGQRVPVKPGQAWVPLTVFLRFKHMPGMTG